MCEGPFLKRFPTPFPFSYGDPGDGGWVTPVAHLAYDPFGQEVPEYSSFASGSGFLFENTGKFFDQETGLEYHSDPRTGVPGRWYSPALERWMSADPTGLAAGPNPFEYANNSPMNFVDPSGLASEGDVPPLTDSEKDFLDLREQYWCGDEDESDAAQRELASRFHIKDEADMDALAWMINDGIPSPPGWPDKSPWSPPPSSHQTPAPAAPSHHASGVAYGGPVVTNSPAANGGEKSEFDVMGEARADALFRLGLGLDGWSEYRHSFDAPGAGSDIKAFVGGYSMAASLPFMLATDGLGAGEFLAADAGADFGGGAADVSANASESGTGLVPMEDASYYGGTLRNIAGYEVAGSSGLVGNTYNMNIWGLYSTTDSEGLFSLANAIRNEASAAGALDVSITGNAIINQSIMNVSPTMAARLGFDIELVNSETIILRGSVP